MRDRREEVGRYLSQEVQEDFCALSAREATQVREVRLRAGKPIRIHFQTGGRSLSDITSAQIKDCASAMLGHALHARGRELREGFVTLPGGHRAGLCGRAVEGEGLVEIASVCIRIAREIHGAADELLPLVLNEGKVRSTLLLSPPGCGKTTVLRDAIRQISNLGQQIAVADERAELAACEHGVPQLNVGENTDVIDGCTKAYALRILLRGMSPDVLAADEIGGEEDTLAIARAMRCGVSVLATAHGADYRDAAEKLPFICRFERIVVLKGMGEVRCVYDGNGNKLEK